MHYSVMVMCSRLDSYVFIHVNDKSVAHYNVRYFITAHGHERSLTAANLF